MIAMPKFKVGYCVQMVFHLVISIDRFAYAEDSQPEFQGYREIINLLLAPGNNISRVATLLLQVFVETSLQVVPLALPDMFRHFCRHVRNLQH